MEEEKVKSRITGGSRSAEMKQSSNLMERVMVERCCALSMMAHSSSPSGTFLLRSFADPSPCCVFAFPTSWSAGDWIAGSPFGESAVDSSLFPSLRNLGNDLPAVVNLAFLQSFQRILAEGSLQAEVHKAIAETKKIFFTGHSLGGAISVLATIWLLEQCSRFYKITGFSLLCVTFGSPLIGDGVFCHALEREGWSRLFIHFVMPLDIVPRIFLNQLASLKEELQVILQILCHKSLHFNLDLTANHQLITFFYSTILRNTLLISSHRACLSMGCTNSLLGTLSTFVKLSPYRPFGKYVFGTRNGRLVSFTNSDAILHLFFYCLQPYPEQELTEVAYSSLREHLHYEPKVREYLSQSVVEMECLETIPLSLNNLCGGGGLVAAFEDLELNVEARLRLRAAGEYEKQRLRNQEKVDANYSKIQEGLRILNDYRSTCELKGLGYYDTFKLQKDLKDFNANVKRLELAGLWDEILEMLRRFDLPDTFESRRQWVNLGTAYRRLVEPLDIANYYRHSKNEDTGPYIANGRPKRYRFIQRWLEQSEHMAAGSSLESCFWAMVEELSADVNVDRPFDGAREEVVELEKKMVCWMNDKRLGADVLMEGSTFVKWWKSLPEFHKSQSCIVSMMSKAKETILS